MTKKVQLYEKRMPKTQGLWEWGCPTRCDTAILENEKTLGTRLALTVMAEVGNSRSIPSGHDEQFVNPPDEDLHCIICFLPSKEPVLTRCGHRFCRQCLEEYMRRYS